ncbi:MAG: hypothetical protein Q8R08_01135, partial [bacterium]|nr:hypothetical protein [bacterium]
RKEQFRFMVKMYGGHPLGVDSLFGMNVQGQRFPAALDLGLIGASEIVSLINNHCCLGRELTPESFMRHYRGFRSPSFGTIDVAKRLKSLGYTVVGVSDCGHVERAIALELLKSQNLVLDEVFCSCDHRLRKPLLIRKVVEWAKQRGFSPQRCVLVDDDIDNLELAKDDGMAPILYHNTYHDSDLLEIMLKKLGIFASSLSTVVSM